MASVVDGSVSDILHSCVSSLFDLDAAASDFEALMDRSFGLAKGGEHAWTVRPISAVRPHGSASAGTLEPSEGATGGDEQEQNLSDDDASPSSGRKGARASAAGRDFLGGEARSAGIDDDAAFMTVSPANASSVLLGSGQADRRLDTRTALGPSQALDTPMSITSVSMAVDQSRDSARQAKAEGLLASLRAEKSRLKRHLRALDEDFEAAHARKPSRAEKEHLRPQYERYRALKRRIDSFHASGPGTVRRSESAASSLVTSSDAASEGDALAGLKVQKRELQVRLRNFEEDFRRSHGRAVQFHKDIRPVEDSYRLYKDLKRQIAKLEAARER